MKVKDIRSIHFVGIKGIAMAALAVYCKERGIAVTGSDVDEEFPSDEVLQNIHIIPFVGFDVSHIQKPDLVIYTGAHKGRENVEVQKAVRLGISVLSHGKALGRFMEGFRQISVAGCHGKTTTTAMIASIIAAAGLDPSYTIGSGMVRGLGLPGHAGKGDLFIAEADEYMTEPGFDPTPRFLWQKPDILVITNIDYDHPDAYPSIKEVKEAYQKLVDRMPIDGLLVVFNDEQSRSLNYPGNIIRINTAKDLLLSIPGQHNAMNATMASVVAEHIGISSGTIKRALQSFGGAKRRFEFIGEVGSVRVYDDYAHHPREIRATIAAAREKFPDKFILVIFQPHTYSRTKALLQEFACAFNDADEVILTDIYSSARETVPDEPIMDTLVDMTQKNVKQLHYLKKYKDVKEYVKLQHISDGIIMTMGAGDISTWGRRLLYDLR